MPGASAGGEGLSGDLELSIREAAARERPDGALDVNINTSRGEIRGSMHVCDGGTGAVVFVGGALGGLDGPAGGLYPRLGEALRTAPDGTLSEGSGRRPGLTSLRLQYRQPGEFEECLLDVLAGVSFLKGIGARRAALVGHSFGAAVAIKAGELSELVAGVAALSPQLFGTRGVEHLSPKRLLLVHGTSDAVLDSAASRDIFERAREPKRLVLYEGAGHGLMERRDELFDLLSGWLADVVGAPP